MDETAAKGPPDAILVAAIGLLVALGVTMVFSASSAYAVALHQDAAFFLKRQLAWLAAALVAALLAYRIDYRQLRKVAPIFLGACVLSLLLVFVPHVGVYVGGARRWIGLGPFSFEPSEFAKLALVLYLASALTAKGERIRSFTRGVFPLAFVTLLMAVLVVKEPDLGTASLLAFTSAVMLFVAGARPAHLAVVGLALLLGVGALIKHDPYKLARVTAFIDPWADPVDKGFHIVQSLMALGSGGWTGLGLGFSRQKFFYLPEAATDFIAAIIGEELGFIGLALIIVLFVVFAYRACRIALQAPDRFGFLLTVGCLTMIVIQAFVNLGVVTSSWPVTGVPLPFISFGGSSLVTSLVAVALVVNVGRHRRALRE